jgi:hypothetical protein
MTAPWIMLAVYPKRDDPVEVRAERLTIEGKTTELR